MNSGKVGARITKLMLEKNINVDQLADQTGLKPAFLNQIMAEDLFPSLGPMLKIARSLGIRLGTLLDDQAAPDPLIVRQDDPKTEIQILPDKDKPVEMKFYSLGRGKTDRHMEPFFIEILPESSEDKVLSSHEGEEFIVVTDGEIEVIYGKEIHHLKKGDSIYYNSIVPHYVSCQSKEKASIYAVLYIPE